MTFSDYYFNSSDEWYDEYVDAGELAYIEMYQLEDEVKEAKRLDRYVWKKEWNRQFRIHDN